MKDVLQKVLQRIKPVENINKKINSIVSRIERALKKCSIKADVEIGGSIAKGTYLRGDHDCDLFVRFAQKYDDNKLSELLEKALKSTTLPIERIHGSRDYFQTTIDDIDYEIVPVRKIKKPTEALNVTDCSYLHVMWVKKRASEEVDGILLNDHIRIAKSFCKAQRVYGAESYIGGVSGHVLDILILHYGGFKNFVEAVSKWDTKEIIDTEEYYKNKNDVLASLNTAKKDSPLILIDPIDKERNAAAALEQKKYTKLTNMCKRICRHATLFMFNKHPLSKKNWVSTEKDIIEISLSPIDNKKDIAGAKMRKVFEFILKKLDENGFEVKDSEFWWDGRKKGIGLMYLPKQEIDKDFWHQGPPITNSKGVKSFKEKHKNAIEKDGRLIVKLKREYISVKKLLRILKDSEYMEGRVKGYNIV
jgi:tRNA nucleotidyltransferase (CCA-adding enzyme)